MWSEKRELLRGGRSDVCVAEAAERPPRVVMPATGVETVNYEERGAHMPGFNVLPSASDCTRSPSEV